GRLSEEAREAGRKRVKVEERLHRSLLLNRQAEEEEELKLRVTLPESEESRGGEGGGRGLAVGRSRCLSPVGSPTKNHCLVSPKIEAAGALGRRSFYRPEDLTEREALLFGQLQAE
ncbi:unnamed protein product, partial [Choristocarpus tenellus]